MKAQIDAYRKTWAADSVDELRSVLSYRDERGGAEFWITLNGFKYPHVAMRISSDLADVHYFPADNGLAFRRLGGAGLPEGGVTRMVFMGCDPGTGEDTPNEFIVTSEEAVRIAEEFLCTGRVSCASGWLEL